MTAEPVPCKRCNSINQRCTTQQNEKDCNGCKPLKVKCERQSKFNPFTANGVVNGLTGLGLRASGGHGASNAMGVVFKLQEGYHLQEYRKILKDGTQKAAANEERAIVHEREMNTPQVQAADMRYGSNGIDESNGFVRDKDGNIKYVGKK
ncbi:hypothetical protein MKEN_01460600 [Mycena kentingensis (nom. inval.)]|nr:hypothetical protein MKEN_01460600 [Mycena kentingensis (nom. inval.)]